MRLSQRPLSHCSFTQLLVDPRSCNLPTQAGSVERGNCMELPDPLVLSTTLSLSGKAFWVCDFITVSLLPSCILFRIIENCYSVPISRAVGLLDHLDAEGVSSFCL